MTLSYQIADLVTGEPRTEAVMVLNAPATTVAVPQPETAVTIKSKAVVPVKAVTKVFIPFTFRVTECIVTV